MLLTELNWSTLGKGIRLLIARIYLPLCQVNLLPAITAWIPFNNTVSEHLCAVRTQAVFVKPIRRNHFSAEAFTLLFIHPTIWAVCRHTEIALFDQPLIFKKRREVVVVCTVAGPTLKMRIGRLSEAGITNLLCWVPIVIGEDRVAFDLIRIHFGKIHMVFIFDKNSPRINKPQNHIIPAKLVL